MQREIYIGDVVRTEHGVGVVRDVRTWRDKIEEMEDDWQAQEFSAKCLTEVGKEYREKWVEILVVVDGKPIRFQWSDVEVMEGRDAKTKPFGVVKSRKKISEKDS